MSFSSIDTNAAEAAATTIDTGLTTIGEALRALSVVRWQAKDFGLLPIASTAGAEVQEEAVLVARAIRLVILMSQRADSTSLLIDEELERTLNQLGISLDDDDGSKADAAAVRADLDQQLFGDDRPQPGDDGYEQWLVEEYLPTVLAEGTPAQVAAAWDTLSAADRQRLIDERPDLIINHIVGAGLAITLAEKDRLEDRIAFATDTEAWAVNVDGSLKLKKFTIIGEAGVALEVTQLSNGDVLVSTVATAGGGIEVGVDENGAELSASAILELGLGQVLVFDNAEDAQAAVDLLLDAADRPPGLPIPDGWVGTGIKILSPGLGALDAVVDWWNDDEPTVLDVINDLYDEHGHSRSASVSHTRDAKAAFDDAGLGAAAGVEVGVTIIATAVEDGPDTFTVVQSGTVTGETSIPLPGVPGGSLVTDGSASVTQEVVVDTNGNASTVIRISVNGETGVGVSPIPPGVDGVSVDHAETITTSATITVTVPVNADTATAVAGVITGLPTGNLDVNDLIEISDQATVNITTTAGEQTTTSAGVDIGAVDANVEVTHDTTTTTSSHTSYPGGAGFENDQELNDILDNAHVVG